MISLHKYRAIFISDIHLGTRDCKADQLNSFLKNNSCERLYLVGDIIDGWRIKQNKWNWKKSHTKVVRRILGLSQAKTKVTYIPGNHDEFLRILPNEIGLGSMTVVDQTVHEGLDGKKYLVVHGDLFDGISTIAPWMAVVGDFAYDFILWLNAKFNWIRRKLGFGYWSLSKYLKHQVKEAVGFMFKFEKNMAEYVQKHGFNGVICGHIHQAQIKNIWIDGDQIVYMNDGDWVESMTALVETWEGRWEIIHWSTLPQEDATE